MKHNIVNLFRNYRFSSAPMKRIALLGVLLVLFVSGCVDKEGIRTTGTSEGGRILSEKVCGPYKPLFVLINTKFADGTPGIGSGFIAGERDNEFYIVTANHVVQKEKAGSTQNEKTYVSATEIQIRFFWDQSRTKDAEVLINNQKLDVALLCVNKRAISMANKVPWDGLNWCSKLKQDMSVWFIGWKGQSWEPSPAPGNLLNRTTDQPAWINIFINTIQPGNSGTPFITQDCGIVSMAIQDDGGGQSVLSVDIAQIKAVVTERGYAWNLHEKADIPPSGTGHIKIIHHRSNEDAAQRIGTALHGAGLSIELLPYSQWVNPMRANFARLGEMIPDYGGYKLFYSENQKQLAEQVKHVVDQLLGEEKLEIMLVDNRILKALGAEINGMLMVLNNN